MSCFIAFMGLFLLFNVCSLQAQTYHFENYTVGDGLLDSKVYTIKIDDEGYIWLGSLGGLTRFDGNQFVNFTTEEGLSPGGVKSLYIDKENTLWIGHLNGGITRYKNNRFERIPYTTLNNTKDVTAIIPDKDGGLWFTTWGNGVYRFHNPTAPVSEITIENYKGGQLSDIVFGGTTALDSSLFLITDFGIKKFIPDSNRFENYLPEGLTKYFAKTSMLEDSDGNIWYGTQNGGLVFHNVKTDSFKYYDYKDGLETNYIYTIFEDSEGTIWTSNLDDRFVKGGITRIKDGAFKAFNKYNGLEANQIQCFAEDRDGNILMGTKKNGFYVFKGEQFFTITEDEGNGLLNDQVWAIYRDEDNKLWFGTDGGITVYDPSRDQSNAFIRYFNAGNSLLHNNVRIIVPDKNNNLWIGTEGGGMYFYDRRRDMITPNFDINTTIVPYIPIINALVVDSANVLWIGTDNGLGYYNVNTGSRELLFGRNIAGNIISALYIDSEGIIWIGSQGAGVTRYFPGKDIFEPLPAMEGHTPLAFLEDNMGNMWVGTEGRGLMLIANDTIKKTFTTNDGLLSNLVNLLNIDQQNRIYVGTNKGLNRIDPYTELIQSFTTANGFIGIETKNNATLRDEQGRLWFGTLNGVTCFNPALERRIEQEPLTHISKMIVNLDEQLLVDHLKLHHSKKSIVFEYNCIDLTNPDMVEYQFMLEGYDKTWQPPTHETSAQYSLFPGKYTFKVKAKSSDGIWNRQPVTYSFEIKKPFYATFLFFVILVALFSGIILLWIKIREQNLKRENRLLEEKVKERTIELTKANVELALKNKDVTDSIRYAQNIQFALLPPEIPVPDTFVFFKPKDIVSGDFYWFANVDGKEFFAAVDCTGHGVPGAFMSFIGYSSLNKIVKEYKMTQPAEILNQLNLEVRITLHQKNGGRVADGMDLAMVSYDPQTRELQYAGAYNPLYIIRNNELIETKANRFPIGRSTGVEAEFDNHKFIVEKGDMMYIFSDGYPDQFGGPDGKKLKSKAFKKLLLELHNNELKQQRDSLEAFFNDWRGDIEQIDDVLVIGRCF